ncbi:MAG: DNA gyrase modulator, partial [Pseudomonadota bacterium]
MASTSLDPHGIFFGQTDLEPARLETIVADALHGADDGELFLQYGQSESFVFDDGRLKNAGFDTIQGFGLRAISGEVTAYAHATELSEAAIKRAA